MQARYYDPMIGRFYSNDPVGSRDVHSFNRYAYANNNPYRYTDPDGKAVSDIQLIRNQGFTSELGNFHAAQNSLLSEASGYNDVKSAVNSVLSGDLKGAAVSAIMAVSKPAKLINKVVNSNMGHAVERAVERGVFPDAKSAQEGLKQLGKDIKSGGLPPRQTHEWSDQS